MFFDFQVSKLGFGCMGLSGMYNAPLSEEVGISIIKEALNRGITFFDTADVYGPHTNEILVGKVTPLFFIIISKIYCLVSMRNSLFDLSKRLRQFKKYISYFFIVVKKFKMLRTWSH